MGMAWDKRLTPARGRGVQGTPPAFPPAAPSAPSLPTLSATHSTRCVPAGCPTVSGCRADRAHLWGARASGYAHLQGAPDLVGLLRARLCLPVCAPQHQGHRGPLTCEGGRSYHWKHARCPGLGPDCPWDQPKPSCLPRPLSQPLPRVPEAAPVQHQPPLGLRRLPETRPPGTRDPAQLLQVREARGLGAAGSRGQVTASSTTVMEMVGKTGGLPARAGGAGVPGDLPPCMGRGHPDSAWCEQPLLPVSGPSAQVCPPVPGPGHVRVPRQQAAGEHGRGAGEGGGGGLWPRPGPRATVLPGAARQAWRPPARAASPGPRLDSHHRYGPGPRGRAVGSLRGDGVTEACPHLLVFVRQSQPCPGGQGEGSG